MAGNSGGCEFIQVLCLKEISNCEAGSLKDSANADIKCDVRIPFNFGATLGVPDKYYLAGYATAV